MPVNHYTNSYSTRPNNEQDLYERLIVGSIKFRGEDVYYMPRESWSDSMDMLFGEDVSSKFEKAIMIEMFHETTTEFGGTGDFFSKFGVEIRDTLTMSVAERTFRSLMAGIRDVPREGDLLFLPTQQKIVEIRFVEPNKQFFSLGRRLPYFYELRCEAFRYSHDDIDTGIAEIDAIETYITFTVEMVLINGAGDFFIGELVSTGAGTQATVTDWQPSTNTIKIGNTLGEFVAGSTLVGASSNTSWTIQTVNDRSNNAKYEYSDALEIQEQANNIVDLSERNPFGAP